MLRTLLAALILAPFTLLAATVELKDGDRVAFIGGTFMEREGDAGGLELLLTLQHADKNISFRNLGWSGDEADRQTRPPKHPKLEFYLDKYKPTVFIVQYGMMESLRGEKGLDAFLKGYTAMLERLRKYSERIVLLSPIQHEDLGRPWPDPKEHNAQLKLYVEATKKLAQERNLPFLNLFDTMPTDKGKLTFNGVHLTDEGYAQIALALEKELGLAPKPWRDDFLKVGKQNRVQALRERIVRKNLEYFYRYKPQNYEYVYGSRIGNQKGLDTELDEFDPIIETMEKDIFALRGLQKDIPPVAEKFRVPLKPTDANYADPATEQATFTIADGYAVNLWAANPLIGKPVQMIWDHHNRLWISSTTTYPQVKPGETANDQILLVQDTNNDGVADTSTVFADRLLMPTGLIPYKDGCLVFNNTKLLHLRDTDGDGKADRREVLLSGFGVEDNHHSAHSFRWTPTGELHFHQGVFMHSTIETPYGIRQPLRGGDIWSTACIFEFKPEIGSLEIYLNKSGPPNPWGRYYNSWGTGMYNDSSGNDGVQLILPTAAGTSHHIGVPGAKGKLSGGDFVSGRAMPDDIQGDLLINLFKENKVLRMKFSDDGSGYSAKQLQPLITSTDRAFRPVEIRMGPDGAIYIADWYNPLIGHMQHHLHDPQRDKNQGRIWRVTAKGKAPLTPPSYAKAPVKDVLDRLKDPEGNSRYVARRALFERDAKDVLAAIPEWLKSLDPKDPAYDHHRTEALWVYASLRSPQPQFLQQMLSAADPNARAAATVVLRQWRNEVPSAIELLEVLAQDPHPRVRLEAVIALSYLPQPRAAEVASLVLDQPFDRYIDQALKQTFAALQPQWKPALERGELTFGGNVKRLQYALAAAGVKGASEMLLDMLRTGKVAVENRPGVIGVVASVGDANHLATLLNEEKLSEPGMLAHTLRELARAARDRNLKPSGDLKRLDTLLKDKDAGIRAAALRLAGAVRHEAARAELLAAASSADSPADVRAAALDALGDLGGPASIEALKKLASEGPLAVRYLAAAALARSDVKAAAAVAVEVLAVDPAGADATPVYVAMLYKAEGSEALAAAIAAKAPHQDAARQGLRYLNSIGRDAPELSKALKSAANIKPLDEATPDEIKALMAESQARGDAARGEQVFRRKELACLSCHAIGGAGGQVGPDLSGVGTGSQLDYLVEAVLLPSKTVKEGYEAAMVITKDGQIVNGLLKSESKDQIVLRDAVKDEIVIPQSNVRKYKKGGASLMPIGLCDTLARGELLDLVKFLSSLGGKEYSVIQTPIVRRWKTLENVPASAAGAAPTDAKLNELPWTNVFSTVHGTLPLADLRPNPEKKVAFVRFEVDVTTPGKVRMKLNSPKGLSAGLDGAALELGGDGTLDLPRGVRTFTFKVDLAARGSEGLRCEFEDVPGSPGRCQVVGGK